VTLKANWSQGFKAPTIFQLTSFFPPATAPNVDLQPEEAEGWDVGASFDALDGRLTGSVVYFNIDTTNLIQFAAGRYFNVAAAESQGVEVEAEAELTRDVVLRGSYTYTEATNAVTGADLLRIPRNAAFLELSWQATDALQLGAKLVYNGEEADSVRLANPDGRIESWTRIDVLASYMLSGAVEIYGRIENLADAEYQDVFGYGTPGLAGYGGVRLRFD
jgi:vitamin B12 transporter